MTVLLVMVLLSVRELRAQLTVTEGSTIGMTPTEFVQSYLVGSGITILNAKYNDSSEPLNSPDRVPLKARDEIGYFTNSGGAATQMGIEGGVILSTGYTGKAAAGLNPSDNMWGNSQPQESDPDLVILADEEINDKSVLEFDFIPQTDIVSFRYVFGSIEFDGFCPSINDAFGLFLSGPGISGGQGFQNDAVNIAILPNSNNYVTISNICAEDMGNLGNGVYSWWNLKKDYFSYNRLTYVFTASYTVECGQTYHMKFAIGDASDGILDSGVFLEQNSFSSTSVTPNATFSNPLTGQLLVPGCSDVNLFYSLVQPATNTVTVNLTIDPASTATQADFLPNPLPSHLTIAATQTSTAVINLQAVPSASPSPPKTLIINASVTVCATSNTVSSTFTIRYNEPMVATCTPVTICSGGTASLTVNVTGGQPLIPSNQFLILWSNGSASPTITVNPPFGHNPYTCTVTDACGAAQTVTTYVDVGTTPGPAGPITGQTVICTPVTGLVYSIPVITGAETYLWTLPPGITITSGAGTNAITVDIPTSAASGVINVKGHTTYCGDGTEATLSLTIHPAPEPAGPISGSATLCQGPNPVEYSIAPLNFTTRYDWTVPSGVTILSGNNTNKINCLITPAAQSGDIRVAGYNVDCGNGNASVLPLTVNPLPGAAGSITSANGSEVCQRENGVAYSITPVPNAAAYKWFYTGSGITILNNGPEALIDFSGTATPGYLTVNGTNSCGDGPVSSAFYITVKPKPTVEFRVCNAIKTTKNGRPVLLKGGWPSGPTGVYSGAGVSLVLPGVYIFDPASSQINGGGPANGIDYPVMYRYTNIQGCFDDKTINISVYGSNTNDPCPGTVKDQRDGRIYPTFSVGTGLNTRCWLAANLDYGTFTDHLTSQTDNCINEKYCAGDVESNCAVSGGFYQWNEIMDHRKDAGYQDICPPGWHVPGTAEWDQLITFYLGDGIAGSALKDLQRPSGFHGLLTGMNYLNTLWTFDTGNVTGSMFWTSAAEGASHAVARGLNSINPSVSRYPSGRANAFNVRCVRN
jgi:uncharacterized protein (TIGR02145 family)